MQARSDWWKKRMVIVQTNLQAADTAKIDPEALAEQVLNLDADALVFNVGGIYGWYPSTVPNHHVNEFLDLDADLLGRVIRACHKRNIKFIARYDFSLAHDDTYSLHPEWFTMSPDRKPTLAGEKRPGNWDLLLTTCINSAYCREAVAIPVLQESLAKYDIDGVFFNWPHPRQCWCDTCRRAYRARYGVEMPADAKDIDPAWNSHLYKENISLLNDAIKAVRPDVPLILYTLGGKLVEDPYPADVICTETRDSLSQELCDTWMPIVRMQHVDMHLPVKEVPGWSFVHTAPGLDWRHVGLPTPEFDFWLSQIPAAGNTLVHSVTGVPGTVYDKRILRSVEKVNRAAHKVFEAMGETRPLADTALLCTSEGAQSKGWTDALFDTNRPYAPVLTERISREALAGFRVVIAPWGLPLTIEQGQALCDYVAEGGNLIYEGAIPDHLPMLYPLLGLKPYQTQSAYLHASYWRFEQAGECVRQGLNDTLFIGIRGPVAYSRAEGAAVYATLVPPFVDPPELSAKPPERASIRTPQTELVLLGMNGFGKGYAASLCYPLSEQYHELNMLEHLLLLDNLLTRLNPASAYTVSRRPGLYVTAREGNRRLLLNLLNGAGKRPLTARLPLVDIGITVRMPGKKKLDAVLEGRARIVSQDAQTALIHVDRLEEWECLVIKEEH